MRFFNANFPAGCDADLPNGDDTLAGLHALFDDDQVALTLAERHLSLLRRRVLLPARMRTSAGWSDACILNVSSRGALIHAKRPITQGSVVELRHGDHVIVGGKPPALALSSSRLFDGDFTDSAIGSGLVEC